MDCESRWSGAITMNSADFLKEMETLSWEYEEFPHHSIERWRAFSSMALELLLEIEGRGGTYHLEAKLLINFLRGEDRSGTV